VKIVVDADLCTGHARCAVFAPSVYPLDDDGFNALRDQGEVQVAPEHEAEARAGCEACPEGAISLVDTVSED
jgi:ferredoxin